MSDDPAPSAPGYSADNIEAYLELLKEPDRLFDQAEDVVRRQLADSFFTSILVNQEDEITLDAGVVPAVRALSGIEAADSKQTKRVPTFRWEPFRCSCFRPVRSYSTHGFE